MPTAVCRTSLIPPGSVMGDRYATIPAVLSLRSIGGAFAVRHPLRFWQKAWAMAIYGGWLKREARKGRFHYLPRDAVIADRKSVV